MSNQNVNATDIKHAVENVVMRMTWLSSVITGMPQTTQQGMAQLVLSAFDDVTQDSLNQLADDYLSEFPMPRAVHKTVVLYIVLLVIEANVMIVGEQPMERITKALYR